MNERKRCRLNEAIAHLEMATDIVDAVREQEEEDLSNLPENMEHSDRHDSMENAIDHMSDAADDIKSAIQNIEQAKE